MKKMKLKIVAIMLTLPAMVSGSHIKDSVLSITECMKLGIANNLKLKQVEMEVNKSYFQFKEAAGTGLPQINGSASFEDYIDVPVTMVPGEFINQPGIMAPVRLGTKYNASAGIQAGQMIYDATYFASVKLFRKLKDISKLTLEQAKEELVYTIARIYLSIQITDKQIALMDSNLVALRKVYALSEQHFINGLILKTDLDRVSVLINNLETEHDNMLLAKIQQMTMLKYLISYDVSQEIELSDDIDFINFSTASSDTTFIENIEIIILEQKRALANINRSLAKAAHAPSVTAFAAFNYLSQIEQMNDITNNENWFKASYAGIKVAIPIFEGNSITNRMKQRAIEIEQAETDIKDMRNDLSAKMTSEIEKLRTSRNLVIKSDFNKELAGNVFNVTNKQYRQGLRSLTDVLNAQSELNIANMSWLNSLLQVKLSELEIVKLSGTINTFFLNK